MAARSTSKTVKGLKVTAPLVQVSLGNRSVQYFAGDFLPEGVAAESIEHLKSLGYVEEFDAPEADEN